MAYLPLFPQRSPYLKNRQHVSDTYGQVLHTSSLLHTYPIPAFTSILPYFSRDSTRTLLGYCLSLCYLKRLSSCEFLNTCFYNEINCETGLGDVKLRNCALSYPSEIWLSTKAFIHNKAKNWDLKLCIWSYIH